MIPFLKGKKVLLSPEFTDIEKYCRWINDKSTGQFMANIGKFPYTILQSKIYIDECQSKPDTIFLAIYTITKKMIGTIKLHQIDMFYRRAEIGIMIGDTEERRKGYATESLQLIINHAREKLCIHKLYAWIVSDNIPSIKLFEKSGFEIEGVSKDHCQVNGKYVDFLLLGYICN